MRPGERAWVYITDYKYGYGEKGSFSFPSVPPACQLVYDVTMVTCEPPDEVRPAVAKGKRGHIAAWLPGILTLGLNWAEAEHVWQQQSNLWLSRCSGTPPAHAVVQLC